MARRMVYDHWLFGSVMLLLGLGLVMVYSASADLARESGGMNPFLLKQSVAALLGIGAMLFAMHMDYRWLRNPAVIYTLLGISLVLLIVVLFAPPLNNARRWLFVAGISIQPSEFAKLVLVAYVAYQIDKKIDRINTPSFLIPVGCVVGLCAGLVVVGRDLGTALMLVVPACAMIFLAGISWRYLALASGIGLSLAAVAVVLEPYRLKRLIAFLDPEKEPLGSGFQLLQSLIAVGSGGVTGLGPGNSVQKLFFLPSPHADFIFAIVAEELGMLGAVFLLGLLALLLWRGVIAGQKIADPFGRFLAWGFTTLLVAQALIHISVAVALLPTTGIPLPFISHGGSSLVTTLFAVGLLLNLSQR